MKIYKKFFCNNNVIEVNLLKKKGGLYLYNKNCLFLNLFFDIMDLTDDLYYLLYDIFMWNQNSIWFLIKPYYLSFFFKYLESKKWKYSRLLNYVNKNKKYYVDIVLKDLSNFNNWVQWLKINKNLYNSAAASIYKFKFIIKPFSYKRYYFFLFKWNVYYYSYFLNKNKLNLLFFFKDLNLFFFQNNFIYLKKNNKKFIKKKFFFYWQECIFSDFIILRRKYLLLQKNLRIKLNRLLTVYKIKKKKQKKKKRFFVLTLIKEKQKLKLFNLKLYLKNLENFKIFKKILREALVYDGVIAKKRFRRKKSEMNLIIKKKKSIKLQRKKRRTNYQMLLCYLNKFNHKLILTYILIKNYLKYKDFKILYFEKFFINKFFYSFCLNLFINFDFIYIRYLRKYSFSVNNILYEKNVLVVKNFKKIENI